MKAVPIRKFTDKQPTSYLKELEKHEQTNPKLSRKKK
jgi:hypothetical protein